jgi:hypothetical protein
VCLCVCVCVYAAVLWLIDDWVTLSLRDALILNSNNPQHLNWLIFYFSPPCNRRTGSFSGGPRLKKNGKTIHLLVVSIFSLSLSLFLYFFLSFLSLLTLFTHEKDKQNSHFMFWSERWGNIYRSTDYYIINSV